MVHKKGWFWIFLFLIFVCSEAVFGYSSNKWQHKTSGIFTISYNERTKDLVDEALAICHETADIVGTHFGWDVVSDHISVVLSDHYDDAQGESLWQYSLVRIDTRNVELSLYRGETNTLKTILTHELTHVYALRIMESLWTVNVGLSAVSEDVTASAAVSTAYSKIPQWFVEGVAQIGSYQCSADLMDTYRHMLLRDAFLNDRILSLKEMAVFEGTSREMELVYNQGFSFLLFLKEAYPEKPLKTICAYTRDMGLYKGIKRYYGKSVETLYEEWQAYLGKIYDGTREKNKAPFLYPEVKRPLVTEVMSAENGKFLISNWAHDMNRFDLMVMDNDKEHVIRKIRDTGMVLKQDSTDGTVYFNRLVYNRDTGVSNYDIFKIGKDSRMTRVTKGKRSLAFDVKNGHVMFAAYQDGKTEIVVRPPEGEDRILYSFDRHTAVYAISMVDEFSAVLTMGTGINKKAALLSEEKLHYIWEGLPGDVFDCLYAGNGRVIFSSTISGSPQLYWSDIVQRPFLWYRLTDVSGGARFPGIENAIGHPEVSFSLFENGDHRRCLLENPFSEKNPLDIRHLIKETPEDIFSPERMTNTEAQPVFSNVVMAMPTVNLRYGMVAPGELFSGSDQTGLYSMGSTLTLMNAPGNIQAAFTGTMNFPVGYETSGLENFSFDGYLKAHLGKARLTQGASRKKYHTEIDDEYEGIPIVADLEETVNEVDTDLSCQLSKNNFLSTGYTFRFDNREDVFSLKENGTHLGTNDRGRIFDSHNGRIYFTHLYEKSVFDPGNLGAPFIRFVAGMDYFRNRYPAFKKSASSSQEDDYYDYDNVDVMRFYINFSKRWLSLKNRLSLICFADSFYYKGGASSREISPYAYDYLGEEDYFSGYVSYTVMVRESYRMGLGLKINPLIDIFTPVKSFERMHLGIQLEGGGVRYFDGSMNTAHPVSLECSFSYQFHFWTNRMSSFYFRYAVPLVTIDDLQEDHSGRIYCGLEI